MFGFSRLTEVGRKKYFNFSSRKKENFILLIFSYSPNLVFSLFFHLFHISVKKKGRKKSKQERNKRKIKCYYFIWEQNNTLWL